MMKTENEKLTGTLGEKLSAFRKSVPARDPAAVEKGRAAFLMQAEAARKEISAAPLGAETQDVSRGKGIQSWFSRKQRSQLAAVMGSIVLLITLLFGGAGVTLAAAQNSLPDEPLYGLKLWSEDARLEITKNAGEDLMLALAFADRRMGETAEMLGAGETPDQAVQARYRAQVEYALRLAAGMEEEKFAGSMLQIQERLQAHEQQMQQLQLVDGTPEDALREQVQQVVRERIQVVDGGIIEPTQFRTQFRPRSDDGVAEDFPGLGDPGSAGYGPGPYETKEAVPGDGFGPQKTITPTPGGGYGPGEGPGSGQQNGGNDDDAGKP